MEDKKIIEIITDKLKEDYFAIYDNSIHIYGEKIFFLCRKNSRKFLGETEYGKDFFFKESLYKTIKFEYGNRELSIGLFDPIKENSKKIVPLFPHLEPKRINKRTSFGFGDRIGNTSVMHAGLTGSYDIFPVLAQQSAREIVKASKKIEDILHDTVMGIFQSGFKGDWGADADHIRDKEWLGLAINNDYLPYSMFTIDTIDFIESDLKILGNGVDENKDYKKIQAIVKKYTGKKIKFLDWEYIYREDNLLKIIGRYNKSLSHLKSCFSMIKEKISEFDFEPTFDETNIITLPEEHFFLVNELVDNEVEFSTFALRLPGIFEKSVDFIGDESELGSSIKIHNEIVKHFGTYKLSLHSADYKFKVFRLFRNVIGDNFHMKFGGSSWREAVRTIAQVDMDLFREILNISLKKAEENSIAYHMKIDTGKISSIIKTTDQDDLLEIKEVLQLLEISYGTVLGRYRNAIEDLLIKNEVAYGQNITDNYRLHFNKIFF